MESDAKLDNRLFILILQHPREKKEAAATAGLAVSLLRQARLVVGLSWPNLARALGEPDGPTADPQRWAVLHLGSARPRQFGLGQEIVAVDRHGQPMPDQQSALRGLNGAVLLDGSWSEAKALWWRNPWLLKLRRLVLDPQRPSSFNRVRREPRREALSTIEAAALVLGHIEKRPDIEAALTGSLGGIIAELGAEQPRARSRMPSPMRNRGPQRAANPNTRYPAKSG